MRKKTRRRARSEPEAQLPFCALMMHLRLCNLSTVPGGEFIVEVQCCLSKLAELDKGDKHLLYEAARLTSIADLVKQRVFTKGEAGAMDVSVEQTSGPHPRPQKAAPQEVRPSGSKAAATVGARSRGMGVRDKLAPGDVAPKSACIAAAMRHSEYRVNMEPLDARYSERE